MPTLGAWQLTSTAVTGNLMCFSHSRLPSRGCSLVIRERLQSRRNYSKAIAVCVPYFYSSRRRRHFYVIFQAAIPQSYSGYQRDVLHFIQKLEIHKNVTFLVAFELRLLILL